MIHLVVLDQDDVAVSLSEVIPATVLLQLTVHGMAKVDEARTKHGNLAVFVRVEFPSDEFYSPEAGP